MILNPFRYLSRVCFKLVQLTLDVSDFNLKSLDHDLFIAGFGHLGDLWLPVLTCPNGLLSTFI